jgi:hypothetical protein
MHNFNKIASRDIYPFNVVELLQIPRRVDYTKNVRIEKIVQINP